MSELTSLELKLRSREEALLLSLSEANSLELSRPQKLEKMRGRGFVMEASDSELEDAGIDMEKTSAKRFLLQSGRLPSDPTWSCDSRTSTGDMAVVPVLDLITKRQALVELSHEHHFEVKDEIRNAVSAMETNIANENKRYSSSLEELWRLGESRRMMDKRVDTQYRRKIAEALDSHLTVVQKGHDEWSQIEHRRIRNDASVEEAKRREKENLEAKSIRELRIAAEKKKIEEKKREAAAERVITPIAVPSSPNDEKTQSQTCTHAHTIVRASETALKLERDRIDKCGRLPKLESAKAFEMVISRQIKQITGTEDVVRQKAGELIRIFNTPGFSPHAGLSIFAEKVVSLCGSPGTSPFALARSIALIASAFPLVTDLVVAEFYRGSVYMVPKHLDCSGVKMDREYVEGLRSTAKLYGAMMSQTEEGMREGWTWTACLLNSVPPNLFAAVALEAFLQTCGFALFSRYGSQFLKMINLIPSHYTIVPKEGKDDDDDDVMMMMEAVVTRLNAYVQHRHFLHRPQGSSLPRSTLSSSRPPASHLSSY